MSHKESITSTKTVVYYCDICQAKCGRVRKCSWCKRDICGNHVKYDHNDFSDYPDKYCTDCWPLAKEYLDKKFNAIYKLEDWLDKLEIQYKENAKSNIRS